MYHEWYGKLAFVSQIWEGRPTFILQTSKQSIYMKTSDKS